MIVPVLAPPVCAPAIRGQSVSPPRSAMPCSSERRSIRPARTLCERLMAPPSCMYEGVLSVDARPLSLVSLPGLRLEGLCEEAGAALPRVGRGLRVVRGPVVREEAVADTGVDHDLGVG